MSDKFENTDQKTTQTSNKRRIWKLQKPEVHKKYKKAVEKSINSSTLPSDLDLEGDVESIMTEIKSCLINVCDSVCGCTKGNSKQEREIWWWDKTVESQVNRKQNYGRSGRKEPAKKNIWRQKGKTITCICF